MDLLLLHEKLEVLLEKHLLLKELLLECSQLFNRHYVLASLLHQRRNVRKLFSAVVECINLLASEVGGPWKIRLKA